MATNLFEAFDAAFAPPMPESRTWTFGRLLGRLKPRARIDRPSREQRRRARDLAALPPQVLKDIGYGARRDER